MTLQLRPPVIAFTGAGISTASGIPDFRGPGGVWEHFDAGEFTIDRFMADPATFWQRRAGLIAAMDYVDAAPNAAHMALADAVSNGHVQAIITQNVDGLHLKAGTPKGRLIELHGNGAWTRCVVCGTPAPVAEALEQLRHDATPACPCGGTMKPDVVLFGEPVPQMGPAMGEVTGAGTLLVIGTSLSVHPAAGLVDVAVAAGADLVIVNREPTPYDAAASHLLRGPIVEEVPRLFPPSLQ